MELNPGDTNETLVQQITRIVKDFDEAHTYKGVREEKLSNIKFCDYHLAKQKIYRKEKILNVSLNWFFTYQCILKIKSRIHPNRTWKKIAAMEAREHILMLEMRQMAAELIVKLGIIDLQSVELFNVRTEFAEKANKIKENEEKFRNVLDSLNPKVLF